MTYTANLIIFKRSF